MTKSLSAKLAALIIAAAVSPFAAIAADGAQAELTRPAGYTPIAGDLKLGEQLFNDSKLSTNGMLRFPRFFVHQRVRFKLPIYPFPADAASFAETCTAINI